MQYIDIFPQAYNIIVLYIVILLHNIHAVEKLVVMNFHLVQVYLNNEKGIQ